MSLGERTLVRKWRDICETEAKALEKELQEVYFLAQKTLLAPGLSEITYNEEIEDYLENHLKNMFDRNNNTTLISIRSNDNKVIAFCFVYRTQLNFAKISSLVVHPDERRKNFGSTLLKEAAAWGKQRELTVYCFTHESFHLDQFFIAYRKTEDTELFPDCLWNRPNLLPQSGWICIWIHEETQKLPDQSHIQDIITYSNGNLTPDENNKIFAVPPNPDLPNIVIASTDTGEKTKQKLDDIKAHIAKYKQTNAPTGIKTTKKPTEAELVREDETIPIIFAKEDKERFVEVLFGTNRTVQPANAEGHHVITNTVSPELSTGKCVVHIPNEHIFGTTRTYGSWEKWWHGRDPTELVIRGTNFFSHDDFQQEIGAIDQGNVLVVIHGYNVSFNDCVLRTAQLSFDMLFKGIPCCFSWPSQGTLASYFKDGKNIANSVDSFVQYLNLIAEALPEGKKIHILAHSMGNRLLVESLEQIEQSAVKDKLGHLIFAAADVNQGYFVKKIESCCEKFGNLMTPTMYCNKYDLALAASLTIHAGSRFGSSPVKIRNCSVINSANRGEHSYIYSEKGVVCDLHFTLAGYRTEQEPRSSYLEFVEETEIFNLSPRSPQVIAAFATILDFQ